MPINQITQDCSTQSSASINSTHNNSEIETETNATNEISNYEEEGKEIWKLSQARNTTDNLTSFVKKTSEIPWKKSVITYLPQFVALQFGGNVLSARSITSSIPPTTLLENDIMSQSLSFSYYSNGIINNIAQFVTRFEDPLRFPAADGAYIPTAYATVQKNHDINNRLV
jgi:hypothetical protein